MSSVTNRLEFRVLAFTAALALVFSGFVPGMATCACASDSNSSCAMNPANSRAEACPCCAASEQPATGGDRAAGDGVSRTEVCGCAAGAAPLAPSTEINPAVPGQFVHKPALPVLQCALYEKAPVAAPLLNSDASATACIVASSSPPHYLSVCSFLI